MSNEITVKLKCNTQELSKILKEKEFRVLQKFIVDDIYYVPVQLNIEEMAPREILKKAVLLRDITEFMPIKKEIKKFAFKKKDIDENGNILSQEKIECHIDSIEEAEKFIKTIGFKELMRIKEYDVVYGKGRLNLIVKNIEDGDDMMEAELVEDDEELNTIDKMKEQIRKLNIPVDYSDYFVKKAEIKLEEILKKKNNEIRNNERKK